MKYKQDNPHLATLIEIMADSPKSKKLNRSPLSCVILLSKEIEFSKRDPLIKRFIKENPNWLTQASTFYRETRVFGKQGIEFREQEERLTPVELAIEQSLESHLVKFLITEQNKIAPLYLKDKKRLEDSIKKIYLAPFSFSGKQAEGHFLLKFLEELQ